MSRRESRKERRNNFSKQKEIFPSTNQNQYYQEQPDIPKKPNQKSLIALNQKQKEYINLINTRDIVFAIGSAGTSKTYLATSMAAIMLLNKDIEKIILTRPAVEAYGEKLGSLPGEIEAKMAPYLAPFIDCLEERLGVTFTEYCIKKKKIEVIPLAYMNGRSLKNCIILADEMQNTNPDQMKMVLTRLGTNSKLIVTGDLNQRNNYHSVSGLYDAINKVSHLNDIGFIEFDKSDIVRSDIVQKIIECYEQ